nr:MAG: ORF1 [Torque teno midi virus]
MPFYWRRRKRFWYTPWWVRRNHLRRKRRNKTRRYRKRRSRLPTRRRRRRRRRYKVRRKKQTITLKQWQPDSITKCKIKGLGVLCCGAEGSQMYCYTNQKYLYPQPKAPGGGGFGCEVFSLQYLFEEWLAHRNIWTKSNDYKDLVRFTGSKFTFYRHETTDFVIRYHRQPPFDIDKDTYMSIHPLNMLLSKHHRVLQSRKSNPKGKSHLTLKIKPTKQMINKWFFQSEFTKYDLLRIDAAAANMPYAIFGPNTANSNLTLYALNTNFYQTTSWQKNTEDHPYVPYPTYPTSSAVNYTYPIKTGTGNVDIFPHTYLQSVNRTGGMFDWRVLQATTIRSSAGTVVHERPMTVIRYNPDLDTGDKNLVYVVSITSNNKWATPSDKDLYIVNKPLWMSIYGLWNYILIKKKPATDFFKYHMFVIKSPSIELVSATTQTLFPLIDIEFASGNLPYGELITDIQKQLWYPTAYMQLNSLTAITQCGPYVPKYKNLPSSTWNLTYRYTFYFKWGGPYVEDQPVQNPQDKNKYNVPDTLTKAIQVCNPLRQHCKAMFRAWDCRRGLFTQTALKRVSENIQSDTSISSDEAEAPQKKKKRTAQIRNPEEENQEIQTCIQSLCQEQVLQEDQSPQTIQQLIIYQQQQQQQLKLNLIKLLTDLKYKQKMLQLHTGVH